MKKRLLFCMLACSLLFPLHLEAQIQNQQVQFQSASATVTIETLDDDLLHIRFSPPAASPAGNPAGNPIAVSDMIHKRDYKGATLANKSGNTLETKEIMVKFDPNSGTLTVIDKLKKNFELVRLTGFELSGEWKGIKATRHKNTHFYGLGQQFNFDEKNETPKLTEFDWNGKKREGGKYGNEMIYANGGATGNTQIPVLYVVNGASYENYALFLDNTYKHRWDFTNPAQWTVEANGGEMNLYLMTGTNLKDLHADYMELTGKPLMPPKKMFGLWVSEYGFDDWAEVDSKLTSLRKNNFPVDGFVFDLQWFGNIQPPQGKMGNLAWDTRYFPNPKAKLAAYEKDHGVGVMLIEEPYVDKGLPEYAQMLKLGLLGTYPHDKNNALVLPKAWWGSGSIMDYTNPQTSRFIHTNKRKALIEDGVIGHWADLGEPENYNDTTVYFKGSHKDVHNIFGFYWLKGIYDGYQESKTVQRPFIMARSGTAGMQRFGVAMWSGDISSRMSSLAGQTSAQANMALSGIDFYGSDIGGFHRRLNPDTDINDIYTRWFAYGSLFELPARPHTVNIDSGQVNQTAPDRIGDVKSNLANLRLRYELIPYTYSLAARAHQHGELVFPPLIYHYQTDKNVENLGDHKMIGSYLLGVASTKDKENQRDVYLPAGVWYDWYTDELISSKGEYRKNVAFYRNGVFVLPLYAREGAILPVMHVDEQTMNAFGRRKDGSVRSELMVKVYPSITPDEFTLYEDDGKTNDYLANRFRTTVIKQQGGQKRVQVTIEPARGNFNETESRANMVKVLMGKPVKGVRLNSVALNRFNTLAELEGAASGFVQIGHWVIAKSAKIAVKQPKVFEIEK